jgi:hypothetical protein
MFTSMMLNIFFAKDNLLNDFSSISKNISGGIGNKTSKRNTKKHKTKLFKRISQKNRYL